MDECRHCGANIASTNKHRRWHEQITRDFKNLEQQVQQLEYELRNLKG
jgi:hypothetical protein